MKLLVSSTNMLWARGLSPVLLFAVAILLILAPAQSQAQFLPGVVPNGQTQQDADLTPEQKLDQLRALLDDPDIQTALGQTPAEQSETAGMSASGFFEERLDRLRAFGQQMQAGVMALPTEYWEMSQIMALELQDGYGVALVFNFLLFLAVGVLVEWLYWRVVRVPCQRISQANAVNWRERLMLVFQRLVLDVGGVVFFGLGSIGMFLALEWAPITSLVVQSALFTALVLRCIHAVLSFVVSPRRERLRMVQLETPAAVSIYRLVMVVSFVGLYAFTGVDVMEHMGFFQTSSLVLIILCGLLVGAVLLAGVWVHERPIRNVLEQKAGRTGGLATLWAVAASAYIITAMAFWAGGLLAMVIVMILLPTAYLLDILLRQAVYTLITDWKGSVAANDTIDIGPEQENPFIPVVMRVIRLSMLAIAGVTMDEVLQLNLLTGDSWLAASVDTLLDIVVALVVADLIWQLSRIWINKKLEAEGGELNLAGQADEGGGVGGTRLQTLLPLFRRTIQITLIIVTVLIVLSDMGVNIGPILAGAGIVGIAIGFGAQTLVRDIVSGIFFLVDDAFRIGEYIEMGELRGKVEGISIRSLRLRHHKGAIHTIPFGELTHITNYSRDWVLMRLEFHMPFDTDMARVKKIVKKVGLEMMDDETHGRHFLMAPKSQGVRRMEEFNMVMAVKFMTVPGEQWVIRREVYHRLLAAFEANGIKLATREVKVAVPEDASLTEEQRAAVTEQVQAELPAPTGTAPA